MAKMCCLVVNLVTNCDKQISPDALRFCFRVYFIDTGLNFTLSHSQDTKTCHICNPQVLRKIHRFSNLYFMNIPKFNRFIRPLQSLLVFLEIHRLGSADQAVTSIAVAIYMHII